MSNDDYIQHKTYYCKVHKKTIYFFKNHNHISGKYHCWDCTREENLKKEKDNERD